MARCDACGEPTPPELQLSFKSVLADVDVELCTRCQGVVMRYIKDYVSHWKRRRNARTRAKRNGWRPLA